MLIISLTLCCVLCAGPSDRARTLHLIASAHIDSGDYRSASQAISQANDEYTSSRGYFLITRMLMAQTAAPSVAAVDASAAKADSIVPSGIDGALDDAIEKMLEQSDFHEELALQVRARMPFSYRCARF